MRPDCAAGGFQSQSHDVSRKPGNNSNRRSGGPPELISGKYVELALNVGRVGER